MPRRGSNCRSIRRFPQIPAELSEVALPYGGSAARSFPPLSAVRGAFCIGVVFPAARFGRRRRGRKFYAVIKNKQTFTQPRNRL